MRHDPLATVTAPAVKSQISNLKSAAAPLGVPARSAVGQGTALQIAALPEAMLSYLGAGMPGRWSADQVRDNLTAFCRTHPQYTDWRKAWDALKSGSQISNLKSEIQVPAPALQTPAACPRGSEPPSPPRSGRGAEVSVPPPPSVPSVPSDPSPDDDSPFGEVISAYSRAQAIEDGKLVDLMQPVSDDWSIDTAAIVREAGIKYPVAMTNAAFCETICEPDAPQRAKVDIKGRLWDVLWMLKMAIKASKGPTDKIHFQVKVKGQLKRLWSVCGPGDTPEPVITIMMEGED